MNKKIAIIAGVFFILGSLSSYIFFYVKTPNNYADCILKHSNQNNLQIVEKACKQKHGDVSSGLDLKNVNEEDFASIISKLTKILGIMKTEMDKLDENKK
ncbi:hypothetical protein N9317_02055 [Pelagibacteraceae bacterium]|nr:hypothetical protein [Pelagibacteraceae bacterium]